MDRRSFRIPTSMLWVAVVSLVLVGCFKKSEDANGKGQDSVVGPGAAFNITDPHWVYPRNAKNKVAVIFIHGIFGDTTKTWTSPNGETFFKLLRESPQSKVPADIFAFGFTSKMFRSGSLSVSEAARMLHEHLKFYGIWEYENVVFVTHSMGGLVAMRTITANREHAKRVPLVVMYATPQQGSQIADVAEHVVNNPAIKDMIRVDGNEFLKELTNDWVKMRDAGDTPKVICAYETKPIKKVVIVPWSSSTPLCDMPAPPIQDADHESIVKPDRPTHPSVIVLVNALNDYVLPRLDAKAWDTPQFKRVADHWEFDLKEVNNLNPATITNKSAVWLDYRIVRGDDLTLHIVPEQDGARIGPRGNGEIKMIPLGELQETYTFELRLASSEPRKIVARIENFTAAQQDRAKRRTSVGRAVLAAMGTDADFSHYIGLDETQKAELVAAAAREELLKELPTVPESVRWVIAADDLVSLSQTAAAKLALQKVESESPALGRSPSVRNLAAMVAWRSGDTDVFKSNPSPSTQWASYPVEAPWGVQATADEQQVIVQLAGMMQRDPDTRKDGLLLKSDLLLDQGKYQEAIQTLEQSQLLKQTKIAESKIRALKEG